MRAAFLTAWALWVASVSGGLAAEPRAFVCKFIEGTVARYNRTWAAEDTSGGLDLIFAGINAQQGKAELVGNAGVSDVGFWKGETTWNFMEVTNSGNVMITTIFNSPVAQSYPSVHSRHTSLGGIPLPSTYRGSCKSRD